MAAFSNLEDRLEQRLSEALPRHGVPGAVLGISIGDEMAVAAAGVASLRTKTPVTRDTLFPIGSVTKVYQAALLLSLGLDIDDPVRRHLPEFRVADKAAAEAITIRHLLTHSSGLESDYIPDLGRGDDAVRLYVESCASLGQLHPPGLLTSYCNSAFIVGGRLVEVIVGSCWDDALRDRLLAPARLESTVSLPEEAILQPVAIGHMRGAEGPVVTSKWSGPRTSAPAGGTLAASAPDVLTFARLHLGETGPLSSEVARSMAEFQRPWPEGLDLPGGGYAGPVGVGLGWLIWDWNGTRVLGHGGTGMGSFASLRLIPDHDAAVVCLVNSWWEGWLLGAELVRGVLEDELGLSARQLQFEANPHPASRYVGNYRRLGVELEVADRPGGGLSVLRRSDSVADVLAEDVSEIELEPVGEDLYRALHPLYGYYFTFPFVDTDGDGICDYVYEGHQANRRT